MSAMELTDQNRLKRTGIAVAVLALVVIGSFSAGRFSAPLQVETREVDRWQTIDLKTEDITRGMTFAKEVQRTVWKNVVTTVVVHPDAGTVTTIADNSIEHIGETSSGTATETEARTEVVTVEREVIVEKTVTLRPGWRVGVLAGAALPQPLLPIAGPLVLGAQVERRVVGGVSVGLWLNTVGAAGAVVSIEF